MGFFPKSKAKVRSEPETTKSMYISLPEFLQAQSEGYMPLHKHPDVKVCIKKIADLVSSMPIYQMQNAGGIGNVRLVDGLSRKVDIDPNPYLTRKTLIYKCVEELLIYGNSFLLPVYDRQGLLQELKPIENRTVSLNPLNDGGYVAKISNTDFASDEIINFVNNPSYDYPWQGRSYRVQLADVLRNIKQSGDIKSDFYTKHYRPGLIFFFNGDSDVFDSEEKRDEVFKKWIKSKPGQPYAFPEGLIDIKTFQNMSLSDIAINESVELGNGIVEAMPAMIEKIPEIVIKIADLINDNAPRLLVAALGLIVTLAKGLVENIPVVVENIPKIIEAIVKAFLAFGWINLGGSIIKGLSQGLKSASGFAKNAATDIGNTIKNNFKELPSKMLEIGKDVIKGLWNGISSMKDWLKGQVAGVVNGIKGVFTGQSGFDTHSPSKWSYKVGDYVVEGFANGLSENSTKAEKAASELSKGIMQNVTSWIEDKKFYNQLSLKEELDFWRELKKLEGLQGEELKEIDKKIYTAKQAILQKENDATKKILDNQKNALDEYQSKIDNRVKSLEGFAGVFDKIESNQEISGKELLANLKGQVKAFKDWQSDIDELANRGISDELLAELQDMGPKAADEIKALTQLSSKELQSYVDLFAEKGKLATDQAEKEIGGISGLSGIDMAIDIDTSALTTEETAEVLNSAAANIVDTMNTGITENIFKVTEVAKQIADDFATTINDFSGAFRGVGVNMVDGLWDGINSGKSGLINNIVTMLQDAVRAAKEAMDINSPSKVWAEIGGFMSEGLGVGFVETMQNVTQQMANAIPSDFDGATNNAALKSISGVLTAAGNKPYRTSNITNNQGDINFHFDKFVNSNGSSTKDIMREAEFYKKSRSLATGGD